MGFERPALDEESERQINALIAGDEYRTQLAAALDRLPPKLRESVQLRVIDELSYEDIAMRLNCRVQAARTRVHRGLTRLNELLEEPS